MTNFNVPRNPGDPGPFERATVTDLGAFSGFALRADAEQQQQQQGQQQQQQHSRRFLDEKTMLPQEEVVTILTHEIRQINQIVPRGR
jgi:hypothetical protein